MTFEVWWRNPVTDGRLRMLEVADEDAARELVEHYEHKYGSFPGYQPAEYRARPEAADAV